MYEAGLLHKENPVINLNGADLNVIDLRNNISGSGDFLINVSGTQPIGGKVESSKAANLSGAILRDANLEGALLFNTDLSHSDLSDAHLSGAALSSADLYNANLRYADLSNADLSDVDLSGANLSDADLSEATGITNEELEQQASSLDGATMPNGQKYEDWIKSKEKGKNE